MDLIDLLRAIEDDTSIRVSLRDAAWTHRMHLLRDMPAPPSGELVAPVGDSGRVIGALHHRAKLSDQDVELIHELRAAGLSLGAIAAKLDDVYPRPSRSTIADICAGRTRAQTVMGHRRISRRPDFMPAHVDEFELCG